MSGLRKPTRGMPLYEQLGTGLSQIRCLLFMLALLEDGIDFSIHI